MVYLRWFLVCCLFGVLACEKVTIQPVPPTNTPSFAVRNLHYTIDENHELQLNFKDSLGIRETFLTTIVKNPTNGFVESDTALRLFKYNPVQDYFGSDSIRYRVCIGSVCKDAVVFISIKDTTKPKPCISKLKNLNFSIAIDDTLDFNIKDSMQLCDKSKIAVSIPKTGKLEKHDIYRYRYIPKRGLPLNPPADSVEVSVTDSSGVVARFKIKIRILRQSIDCGDLFQARPDTFRLPRGQSSIAFSVAQLLANDKSCAGDRNLNTFEIIPIPGRPLQGQLRFIVGTSNFSYSRRPQGFRGTDIGRYRICNNPPQGQPPICKEAEIVFIVE